MILFLILLFLVLVDLFSSQNLVQAARAFFRTALVFCIAAFAFSDRPAIHAGAGLLFGFCTLASFWALRGEVQRVD
jgi:hypothetical protein